MASKKEGAGQSVKETREQEKAVEEAAAQEERVPQEFYEVRVNPRLGMGSRDAVSIGGKIFYADEGRNRQEGTWVVDDIQWEEIGAAKHPDTGVKYINKIRTIGDSEASDEGGEG